MSAYPVGMGGLPEPLTCSTCGTVLRDEFEGFVCRTCGTVVRWVDDIQYPERGDVIDL